MDHHDDWGQWHHEDGNGDTADLGGPDQLGHDHLGGPEHLGDLGEHDHLGGYEDHDGYPGATSGMDHGPDLLHESGDYDLPGHDGDAGHDPGHDPAGHDDADPGHDVDPHGHGHYDGPDEQPAAVEHVVGADPDLPGDHDPGAHGGWHDGDFPPPLDLDARPEPADGYPWADPDTLGDPGTPDVEHAGLPLEAAAPAGDLYAYAGLDAAPAGVNPWSLLLGSDDPATSTLARWWGPAAA